MSTTETDWPEWLIPWRQMAVLSNVTVSRRLSRICRYGGGLPENWPWYSVARHSRLVVHLLPAEATVTQRKWALLHDCHEMFTGDILRPLESELSESAKKEIANIRDEMDIRIQSLMGLNLSEDDRRIVQVADDHACELEKQFLGKPDSVVYDSLPDSPEAAYELTVLGRPELDAADWRQMWESLSSEAS